ncbi:unnamed protein product, partial [Darwinula stevensoni]
MLAATECEAPPASASTASVAVDGSGRQWKAVEGSAWTSTRMHPQRSEEHDEPRLANFIDLFGGAAGTIGGDLITGEGENLTGTGGKTDGNLTGAGGRTDGNLTGAGGRTGVNLTGAGGRRDGNLTSEEVRADAGDLTFGEGKGNFEILKKYAEQNPEMTKAKQVFDTLNSLTPLQIENAMTFLERATEAYQIDLGDTDSRTTPNVGSVSDIVHRLTSFVPFSPIGVTEKQLEDILNGEVTACELQSNYEAGQCLGTGSVKPLSLERLSSGSRASLERLSSVSRAALERLSSGSRASLERLSSGSRAALERLSSGSRAALERLSSGSRAALE